MKHEAASLVRRFVEEVINGGDATVLHEIIAEHHVGHDPLGDHYGPEGMGVGVMELRSAFPDLRMTIDDVVPAADRVALRFTFVGTHRGPFIGLPATGRSVTVTGLAIDRAADGRLVERWTSLDVIGLMRQLGATPVLRQQPSGDLDVATPGSGRVRGEDGGAM